MPSGLTRGWHPVRQGEPLFADKDMRQDENQRRFPIILVNLPLHPSGRLLGKLPGSCLVADADSISAPDGLRIVRQTFE
jgi:hypothetical protein